MTKELPEDERKFFEEMDKKFGVRYYDRDGTPMSMADWALKFENWEYKRVGRYKNAFVIVSTVWLGLDHRFGPGKPLIFESMAFLRGPGEDLGDELDQKRYSTIEEARIGHEKMVKKYRYRFWLLGPIVWKMYLNYPKWIVHKLCIFKHKIGKKKETERNGKKRISTIKLYAPVAHKDRAVVS